MTTYFKKTYIVNFILIVFFQSDVSCVRTPAQDAASKLDALADSLAALAPSASALNHKTIDFILASFERNERLQNVVRPFLNTVFPLLQLLDRELIEQISNIFDSTINPEIIDSINDAMAYFNNNTLGCSVSSSRYTGRYSFSELAYPLDTCPLTVDDIPGYTRRKITFDAQVSGSYPNYHVASPVIVTVDNNQYPIDYSTFWALDAEVSMVSKLLFTSESFEVSLAEDFSYADMNYIEKDDLYACILHTNFVRQWGYSASLNSFGYIAGMTVKEGAKGILNKPSKFETHDAMFRKYCPFFTASYYSNCLRNICWGT